MSNLTERGHLDPHHPSYYAQCWLRQKSKAQSSLSHEIRSDAANAPAFASGRAVIHELGGLAREQRRGAKFKVAALVAAIVGVSAIGALFFVIMLPASRQSDAGSTSSEITRTIRTAPLQSRQRDEGSKSALADFQSILAPAPPGQNSAHEQSEQLLQQFLQWRQNPTPSETSR